MFAALGSGEDVLYSCLASSALGCRARITSPDGIAPIQAAACADGYVRVYLCQNGLDASDWLLEVRMRLARQQPSPPLPLHTRAITQTPPFTPVPPALQHKFECQECCSVSFSPSRAYAMLAVGVKSGSDVPFRVWS
jgi:hypothetical protein